MHARVSSEPAYPVADTETTILDLEDPERRLEIGFRRYSENPEIVWKPRVEETRGGSERTQFWIMHCHYDDIIQQNMARKANYLPDKRGAECLQEAVLQASQCIR